MTKKALALVLATGSLLSTANAQERTFGDLVADCRLVQVVRDEKAAREAGKPRQVATLDAYASAMRCLDKVTALSTPMQLNCHDLLGGSAEPGRWASMVPSNGGDSVDAIISYSIKHPEELDEPELLTAMLALSMERPCRK